MKARPYFILLSIFLSCNGVNSHNTIPNKDNSITKSASGTNPLAKADSHVMLSNIAVHCFSDPVKKDTFKLLLTGDSLMTAKGMFSIVSYQGERIYADTFRGSNLTKNVDGDPIISGKEKVTNIKESVSSFFKAKAFSSPPVFYNDGNEVTYWNDIKSDKTAIGFEVTMNHVDFRIAYSKKQHKVLVYWNDDEAGD